ncbi:MAG: PAS domain-containing protein [Deltaproteobacteria bacterium]|nr:PAS domain-containing protein [Deltaproteobacteria bacterium]
MPTGACSSDGNESVDVLAVEGERGTVRVQAAMRREARVWFQRVIWFVAALVLATSVGYWFGPTGDKERLVLYRVIGAFLLLSLGWTARRSPRSRGPEAYLIAATVFAAAAVELVVLASGGHQSPFYVGMILLGLGSGGFVPVRLRVHVLIFGLILAIYVGPTILLDGVIWDPQRFALSIAFIAAGFLMLGVLRWFLNRSLLHQLRLETEFRDYGMHLERLVDERTTRHEETIETLRREVERRAELESRILSAKNEWEETFNAIRDPITIYDEKRRIVAANRAAREMFALGRDLAPTSRPFGRPLDADDSGRARATRGAFDLGDAGEFEIFEPDLGKHLAVTAFARVDEHGRTIGTVHVARDLTDAKKAEAERRALEEQLAHAQRMDSLGRIASGVAHDFNNILTAIVGAAEAARGDLGEHPIRADLDVIIEAGHRAGALTQQLLTFGRKKHFALARINLGEIASGMEGILSRLVGDHISLRISTECTHEVAADARQIEQVIMNLVVNARDAMPDGGEITVHVSDGESESTERWGGSRQSSSVVLTVQDTGEGIPASIRSKIFDPFFTTKPTGKGTGLGLATVYGIVAQHGGTIEVASQEGHGALFTVRIPYAQEAQIPASFTEESLPVPQDTYVEVTQNARIEG